jgi:hypothetical protein
MKMHCNSCDGIYRSFDVHFTSACDNNCAHCIDKQYDFIAVFLSFSFPAFLMALPVVLEYKERKRLYKEKEPEEE